jgi:hypothetical protein
MILCVNLHSPHNMFFMFFTRWPSARLRCLFRLRGGGKLVTCSNALTRMLHQHRAQFGRAVNVIRKYEQARRFANCVPSQNVRPQPLFCGGIPRQNGLKLDCHGAGFSHFDHLL